MVKYFQAGLIILLLLSFNSCEPKQIKMEEQKIKKLIEEGYLNGALNEMNTEKMTEAYHPDFAIFFSEGNQLKKLPLQDWKAMVEDYKQSEMSRSGLRDMTYSFEEINITDKAAVVKLKLYRNGELIFTDYLSLLMFDDGWKIVAKIYNEHTENPWKL